MTAVPDSRLTARELGREVSREVSRLRSQAPPDIGRSSHRGRKCSICTDPEARERVNVMLASGMTINSIANSVGDINARRPKNRQITYEVVKNHNRNHFNLQVPASAAYRRILERRATEELDLLAEGVHNILTARGYLEIVASKGFANLVAEDTAVGFQTGLEAQLKLEELIKEDRDQAERATMRRDLGLIQQAIRETLTEDQMRDLSHRIDVLRGVASEDEDDTPLDAEVVDDDDDEYGPDYDDPVAPTLGRDEEDSLED